MSTADLARAYVATMEAYDALGSDIDSGPEERRAWDAHMEAQEALNKACGFDVSGVEAADLADVLVREADRYAALLSAVRDVGLLSCEKIPDGIVLTMDEWRAALCGECPVCRMHKARAELDGVPWPPTD